MSHLHQKISALVDGELHGAARRRALHHVDRCSGCRHELEATLALKRRMAGLSEVEPSADLFASLDSTTVAGQRSPTMQAYGHAAAARGRMRPALRKVLVGAGSFSVAVVSLAYAVGGPAAVPAAQRVTPPVDEYAADFAGDTGLQPLADPAADALASKPEPASELSVQGRLAALKLYDQSPSTGHEARAVDELRRAVSAPDRFAYVGVQEVDSFDSGPPTTLKLSVEHAPRQGTSFDLADAPADATATFVARREADGSGDLGGETVQLLHDAYDLSVVAASTVLDRSATVIEASRGGDVKARFWVDDATGLLLRREMFDGGRLVRSTGFTSLQVSKAGFLPHLPPELETSSTTELAMTSAPLLSDYGWTCPPRLPADFVLTGLDRLETDDDVMRASYSDGLSTVSLFEQRGFLRPGGLQGFSRQTVRGASVFTSFGLPTVAVWESGGTVYTVVTDAPHATATAVIDALPHAKPDPVGADDRVATGFARLITRLTSVG